MDIKTRIRVALGIEDETIALAYEGKLKDGTIVVSEADALAEGVEVMVMTEDGTTIDVPVGSYELEDGTTFVVEEEGIIASMGEAEEVEEVEAEDDEDYEEDKEEMSNDKLTEFSEVVMQIFTEMKEEIDALKESVAEITGTNLSQEEEIIDLQDKNTELKKQLKETPATDNVNTRKFTKTKSKMLSATDYKNMTAQEKFLYDVQNKIN